jgi:hypothetical protein
LKEPTKTSIPSYFIIAVHWRDWSHILFATDLIVWWRNYWWANGCRWSKRQSCGNRKM